MRSQRPSDRLRRVGRQRPPALDEHKALRELADHVAPYTDITPPAPPPPEPWFDTRYESPAEGHGRPRDSHYAATEHEEYTPDDYTSPPTPPGPRPSMFDGRAPGLPRFGRPREEKPPTYEDTVHAGESLDQLFEKVIPRPPFPEPMDGPSGEPGGDQPMLPSDPWQDLLEQAAPHDPVFEPPDQLYGAPSAALEGMLGDGPGTDFPTEDPIALAHQAFDQQMRDAFNPPPDPFAEPPGGLSGLEQSMLLEPPPDLYDPFGPGGLPFM